MLYPYRPILLAKGQAMDDIKPITSQRLWRISTWNIPMVLQTPFSQLPYPTFFRALFVLRRYEWFTFRCFITQQEMLHIQVTLEASGLTTSHMEGATKRWEMIKCSWWTKRKCPTFVRINVDLRLSITSVANAAILCEYFQPYRVKDRICHQFLIKRKKCRNIVTFVKRPLSGGRHDYISFLPIHFMRVST